MTGLNLHHIVRGAVQVVNPDTVGAVYVSTGAPAQRGIRTPTFALLPTERLQVQALSHEDLYHLNGLAYADGLYKVYAYGNFAGIVRPDGKGGDLVRLGTEWWALQHVLEWWPGWCSFTVTRQVNAATLEALLAALKNGSVPPVVVP